MKGELDEELLKRIEMFSSLRDYSSNKKT